MENIKRIKILIEILICLLTFILSLLGVHYLITIFLNFTQEDSFMILIPVFLIVTPAVIYGYSVGYKKHYFEDSSSRFGLNLSFEKAKNFILLRIALYVILIIVFSVFGLYNVIFKEAYYLGILITGIGALISIPLSKTLYGFIEEK